MVDITDYTKGDKPKNVQGSTWLRMVAARRWMVWKEEPNPTAGLKNLKVPYYPGDLEKRQGKLDTPEDLARLGTYDQCLNICKGSNKWHMAFALGPDGMRSQEGHQLGWQGYDRDGSVIFPTECEEKGGGYFEISPSGNGSHWIGYGQLFKTKFVKGELFNEEWYSYGRFLTVTEKKTWDGPIIDLFEYAPNAQHVDREEVDLPPQPMSALNAKELRDLRDALRHLDPDPYDNWYRVLMILRQVEGGRALAMEWSQRSDKHKDREFERKFDTVGEPVGHWKSIFQWAKDAGWDPVAAAVLGAQRKGPLEPVKYSSSEAKPIEFVMDGWVACGSLTIAGSGGVGKTTLIMPWAATIAHLTQKNLLTPTVRRDIVYVTEDVGQAERLLYGMRKMGFLTASEEEVQKWITIIEAKKRSVIDLCEELVAFLNKRAPIYLPSGYEVHPLIIMDTAVSNMDVKDQNSAAEIGNYIANIRTSIGKASVWFVTHVAKAAKFGDPEHMSARGSDSWVADVQGEMIVFPDPDDAEVRRAMLGKRRFDPKFTEIELRTMTAEEAIPVPWSEEPQLVRYRAAVVYTESSKEDRKKAAEVAKEEKKENDLQFSIMEMVKAFKADLEDFGAIFFSTKPGRAVPPAGVMRRSVRDHYLTIQKNQENVDMVLRKFCECCKWDKVEGGIVFRRQEVEDLE